MKEKLSEIINDLHSNKNLVKFDEAATKQTIILRILSSLGWDQYNRHEVYPEYTVGTKKVDYALRINQSVVFIEVKKVSEDLEKEKHQEQLLNYSFQQGVKLAILTNGITWWFYLPLHEGNWNKRKIYSIDINEQNSEEIATKFIKFLSYENVKNGIAFTNAEKVKKAKDKQKILEETIPKAWTKILNEFNPSLIELINETIEKISGYRADEQLIQNFIQKSVFSNIEQTKRAFIPPTLIHIDKIPENVMPNLNGQSIPNVITASVVPDTSGKSPKYLQFSTSDMNYFIDQELINKYKRIIPKEQKQEITKKCRELKYTLVLLNKTNKELDRGECYFGPEGRLRGFIHFNKDHRYKNNDKIAFITRDLRENRILYFLSTSD